VETYKGFVSRFYLNYGILKYNESKPSAAVAEMIKLYHQKRRRDDIIKMHESLHCYKIQV
jgi:hypothetical protein